MKKSKYMEKLKQIYSDVFEFIKTLHGKIKLSNTQKTTAGLIIILIILGLAFGIQTYRGNQTTKSELATIIDSGSNLLNESKNLKTQFLEKKISEQDYKTKRADLELKIEEVNKSLHEINLRGNVNVEKTTLESAGDALQVLSYLIFESKNLKDLNDEILALNIILEDIKSES